ncbi:MAG: VOC family protein [Beijerinckiaceae bacterium]
MIDHLVIPSRNLDAQADLLRRMGFQVGARNRHPWGTENHIVQFSNRTFLEPIAIGHEPNFLPLTPDAFSFGGFISDYLREREGLAMLVLRSDDASADKARFDAAGIGWGDTFFFERKGARPDGTPVHVAFTLAFAHDALAPACGFFTCQQHFPEAFWNPAAQIHANGAVGVTQVVMVADDPRAHDGFRADFGAAGALAILTPATAESRYGTAALPQTRGAHFAAFHVAVPALDRVRRVLEQSGLPFDAASGRMIVPASAGLGCACIFEIV